MKTLDIVKYAFVPRRCELCGEVVEPISVRCEECMALDMMLDETCKICGSLKDDCKCKSNARKPEYECVVAPYYFKKNVSKAVIRFKNYGYTELAPNMAKDILKVINAKYCDVNFDCVTFVPITKSRSFSRGYNQAELLAKEIAKGLILPCKPLLKKNFNTKSQRKSSAKERRNNLHGAFDLNADVQEVEGKTILLIDDVKTTGSTLNECALVLNGYGAKKVYASTFALPKLG